MNPEMKFYNKHPIWSLFLTGAASAIVGFMLNQIFNSPVTTVRERPEFITNDNRITNIFVNSSSPAVGTLTITANPNDTLKNITVIDGAQYLSLPTYVSGSTGVVQFKLPSHKDVQIQVASGDAVTATVKVDRYGWLKKYFSASGF